MAQPPGPDQETLQFAQLQFGRELGARESVARGAGIALIQLSAILEEDAILGDGVDPLGVVLVAFAARGRRLLRAAYRLMDVGEASESIPLLRTISEYIIVGRWLVKHPDRLDAWALTDIRKRQHIVGEVIRTFGDTDAATTASLEEQRRELDKVERRWLAERGEPQGQIVNVEQMAAQTDLAFAYQLAYRLQSESDVHATPVAADSCYERLPDNRLRLRPAPVHSLQSHGPYELGAHMLRDLLATTNGHVRSFLWATGLEGVTDALQGLSKSDPRRFADPAAHMRAASEEQPAEDAAAEPGASEAE